MPAVDATGDLPRVVRRAAQEARRGRNRGQRALGRWAAGLRRLAAFAVIAVMLAVPAAAALAWQGRLPTGLADLAMLADRLGVALDLDISHVAVVGHRHTSDGEIYSALGLDERATFLGFSGVAARERLARLAWVESTRLVYILPDTLMVEVTERTPGLVWQNRGMLFLVDGAGHILEPVAPTAFTQLPLIVGEGAPEAARDLFDVIAAHGALADEVRAYVRVAERRWTLELRDGRSIHLPAARDDIAGGERAMLAASLATARRLLDDPRLEGGVSEIDLRVPDEPLLLVGRRVSEATGSVRRGG